jgi:hypothetical protein
MDAARIEPGALRLRSRERRLACKNAVHAGGRRSGARTLAQSGAGINSAGARYGMWCSPPALLTSAKPAFLSFRTAIALRVPEAQ